MKLEFTYVEQSQRRATQYQLIKDDKWMTP